MFNHSLSDLIFLLEGDSLTKAIIASLDQAKSVVLTNLGKNQISANDVTSSSKNPLKRATLFKFFEDHSINNSGLYDQSWVVRIFLISMRADASIDELRKVFTQKGLQYGVTNVFRGSLKLDAKLIMHLLWCNKAVLLPFGYPLPYSKGMQNEYAACTYPELLAITQKTGLKVEGLASYPDLIIPPESRDNFFWYFKNFIRSSTWWNIEDISTKDIKDILHSKLSDAPARQSQIQMLRTWLGFFEKNFPERINFNLKDTLSIQVRLSKSINSKVRVISLSKSDVSSVNYFSYLYGKDKDNLAIWLKYLDLWGKKLGQKKVLSADSKRKQAYQFIKYLLEVIYQKQGHIPDPNQLTRRYLDGVNQGEIGLIEYLSENRSPGAVQNIIYNIHQYFDFLALYQSEIGNFSNVISLKIDVPFVRRRKGTVKKIFPSEYYAPFISYLYGLADWVWWMFDFCQTDAGVEFIKQLDTGATNKRYWVTEDTGFVPLVWYEGKAVPINAIPRYIAPVIYRCMAYNPSKVCPSVLPHYINIAVVLAETGIRNSHVHWLDSRTYDEYVERESFDPYSFDITKLHVNTDKVNGAWNCYTSEAVIGVLDRQKKYQEMVVNENIQELVDYAWNSNSPYLPIECLFSLGTASRKMLTSSSGPPIPDTYTTKYRCLLYGFNAVLSQSESFEPFIKLEHTSAQINTEKYFMALYPTKKPQDLFVSKITPHSARSQVVSNYISLLPPSIIRTITGHATDSHLVYYAQLDNISLDKARMDTVSAIQNGVQFGNELLSIKAEDVNSKLRRAFHKSRSGTLKDFGATSFSSLHEERGTTNQRSGLIEVHKQPANQIAFNSTHICPFDNLCPTEVKKEFNGVGQHKPCGRCFYAVKTVDHLPRIYGKIRLLMDQCSELESYIETSKANGASMDILEEASERRRILADDIMGWSVSAHCLESMAKELSLKEKWLVEKPELLSKHIERIECKDGALDTLLLRIEEAKKHAEFFTPTLKHQITKARTKLLAHTGQINKLLQDAPDDFTLLDEFRGQIKSICQATNISVAELSAYLEEPLTSIEASNTPLRLFSLSGSQ